MFINTGRICIASADKRWFLNGRPFKNGWPGLNYTSTGSKQLCLAAKNSQKHMCNISISKFLENQLSISTICVTAWSFIIWSLNCKYHFINIQALVRSSIHWLSKLPETYVQHWYFKIAENLNCINNLGMHFYHLKSYFVNNILKALVQSIFHQLPELSEAYTCATLIFQNCWKFKFKTLLLIKMSKLTILIHPRHQQLGHKMLWKHPFTNSIILWAPVGDKQLPIAPRYIFILQKM